MLSATQFSVREHNVPLCQVRVTGEICPDTERLDVPTLETGASSCIDITAVDIDDWVIEIRGG